MESLTSSREYATFAIAVVESYGRSGKVKENPWSMGCPQTVPHSKSYVLKNHNDFQIIF